MLVPAVCYKKEIEEFFTKEIYSDEYFLYVGYTHCHSIPEIRIKDNEFQYAIINRENKVIGWLAYSIDSVNDTVENLGLYSFDKGNPTVGYSLYGKMEELVKEHRRLEWRMIGGNPVQKHYDDFCEKHNGNRVILHNVCKDNHGKFRDEYIYEIIKSEGD